MKPWFRVGAQSLFGILLSQPADVVSKALASLLPASHLREPQTRRLQTTAPSCNFATHACIETDLPAAICPASLPNFYKSARTVQPKKKKAVDQSESHAVERRAEFLSRCKQERNEVREREEEKRMMLEAVFLVRPWWGVVCCTRRWTGKS
ncbi:hypothetical protein IWZ01DRAFT_224307 [Phyllosticta capitalensis]